MRKRLAALACALTVMFGGVVAIPPAANAWPRVYQWQCSKYVKGKYVVTWTTHGSYRDVLEMTGWRCHVAW